MSDRAEKNRTRGRFLPVALAVLAALVAGFEITPDLVLAAPKVKKICNQHGGGQCTFPDPITPIVCTALNQRDLCKQTIEHGPSNNDICADAPSGTCDLKHDGWCVQMQDWRCQNAGSTPICKKWNAAGPKGSRSYCQ